MRNIQTKPCAKFVILSDVLSNKLFNGVFSVRASQRARVKVLDCRKKGRKIYGVADVENKLQQKDIRLFEFDRAVLDAALTLAKAGNQFFTVAQIYSVLGGDGKHKVPEKTHQLIHSSLARFQCLQIALDLSDTVKNSHYEISNARRTGNPLTLSIADVSINGKTVKAYEFGGSLLFDVANEKSHLIRLPMETVDVKVKLTPRVIAVKHYIVRRVVQILGSHDARSHGKKNRALTPTITFKNLMKCCGLSKPSRRTRQQIRETIAGILDAFVENGVVQNWRFVKSETGEIQAIRIALAPLQL